MKFNSPTFVFVNLCLLYSFCSGDEDRVDQALFKTSEIVPDILDQPPSKKVEVKYETSKKEAKFGNEIAPKDVREIPDIDYDSDSKSYYTLAMIDPDAPSRKNPIRRCWQHWLVVNIPGSEVKEGETLTEYVGSGPPKDTGLHRYVFLVYKQPEKLKFDEPHRNNTHGSTRGNFSMKDFAKKYNLGQPIAGNFYQAQFDDSVPALHKQLSL